LLHNRAQTPASATIPSPGRAGAFRAIARSVPDAVPDSFWTSPESDPREFVARLRADGVPDDLIGLVLRAKLNEDLAALRRQYVAAQPEVPYWLTTYFQGIYADPDGLREIRSLAVANTRLLQELFPNGLPKDEVARRTELVTIGTMPEEKIEEFRLIMADYSDLSLAITAKSQGIYLDEDREALRLIDENRTADLQELFTPAEYEEYQLHASLGLRSRLGLFEPTEQEFRDILALQRAFNATYSPPGGATADVLAQRPAAAQQLEADIRAALPPDRVAAYERGTDTTYRQIYVFARGLDLPKEAAIAVWDTKRDAEQRAAAIRANTSLAPNDRDRQLGLLAEEAAGKVSTALQGARNFESYKSGSGQWLDAITAAPTTGRGGVLAR